MRHLVLGVPVPGGVARHALDLDALGLLDGGGAGDPNLEHAVLEAGVDGALVDALGQRHAAAERAVPALPYVEPGALAVLLGLPLAADGQHPAVQRDVDVLLLDAGQLGPHDDVPVLVQHVERRRPLHRLRTLLAPRYPREPPEHLVEHPVHLGLYVVEPATPERTQCHSHDLLLFPAPPGSLPLLAPPLYPVLQFVNSFG